MWGKSTPSSGTVPARHWWRRNDLFGRFALAVISAELRRLRPQVDLVNNSLGLATRLDETGLGLDSLERMRLGTALCEALQLAPEAPDDGLDAALTVADLIADLRAMLRQGPVGDSYWQGPDGVGFRSSGTQAGPRAIVHAWPRLETELAYWADEFAGARRIVALVPAQHIYGFLFTVALPAMLGLEVIDARNRPPPLVASLLAAHDLVVGHPVFWGLTTGLRWPRETVALSSGGAVDRAAFAAIAAADCRALEIYGATETGGIAARAAYQASFTLLPWWQRAEGAISRDAEQSLLPDVVEWHDERRLSPLRRRDGLVQVGGVNVSPDYVASVLQAHAGVADARVRLMAPGEGERLKAFVVPAVPGDSALRVALESWCRARLQPFECPRAFTFGERLPLTPEGKAGDWPIS